MAINQSSADLLQREAQIEALLDAMTLQEQVSLLAGADFWTTVPVLSLIHISEPTRPY